MVKQYRNALDRITIEIPAGGLNGADEPTMDAARRELEEETGYVASDMKLLVSVRTTVAFCNEKIDIYLATGLKRTAQHLDEDEFVDEYRRNPIEHKNDFDYPVNRWKASDGINYIKFEKVFGYKL